MLLCIVLRLLQFYAVSSYRNEKKILIVGCFMDDMYDVHMCICMYICAFTYIYTRMLVYICMRTHIHMYVHMYVYVYIRVWVWHGRLWRGMTKREKKGEYALDMLGIFL